MRTNYNRGHYSDVHLVYMLNNYCPTKRLAPRALLKPFSYFIMGRKVLFSVSFKDVRLA